MHLVTSHLDHRLLKLAFCHQTGSIIYLVDLWCHVKPFSCRWSIKLVFLPALRFRVRFVVLVSFVRSHWFCSFKTFNPTLWRDTEYEVRSTSRCRTWSTVYIRPDFCWNSLVQGDHMFWVDRVVCKMGIITGLPCGTGPLWVSNWLVHEAMVSYIRKHI